MEVNEVMFNARQLLKERTDSLESDVRYCVLLNRGTQDWPAPFPALLYCFSTIDLLGALYGGNATGKEDKRDKKAEYRVSTLSLNYMSNVMRYPREKAFLLQEIFRHKIVHLAQPNPKMMIDNSIITKRHLNSRVEEGSYTWAYEHNKRSIHLKVEEEKPKEFRFSVSIWSLVEDIVDSVYKPMVICIGLRIMKRNCRISLRQHIIKSSSTNL